MNNRIQEDMQKLKDTGLIIHDEAKILWYLQKVWYYRLFPYMKHCDKDCEMLIKHYLFDKKLRLLIVDILEVIENSLKSVIYYYLWEEMANHTWYTLADAYIPTYVAGRLEFVNKKTEDLKNLDVNAKGYFLSNPNESYLPDYMFFDKLTFGELIKCYQDMKLEYKKQVSSYYGINVLVFDNWITTLLYLRNLCSHYEPIFARTMTFGIKAHDINKLIWNNNTCIAYLVLLSVMQKLLIPPYKWDLKLCEKMVEFSIPLEYLWYQKNSPSKHTSFDIEAWRVLVDTVYTKNIKNARLSD